MGGFISSFFWMRYIDMKILTIIFFSGITFLLTFSHIDSSGLFAKKNCQSKSFNVLADYYHKFEKKQIHGKKCNTNHSRQLALVDDLTDYYAKYERN